MRILIKGAGDLATGIAYRLKRCGYEILMTETAIPTTVRRTVAFSRAVYEGTATVEGVTAVLVHDIDGAEKTISADMIPVIVDEGAKIKTEFSTEVVIDAIIAKRNLGTGLGDAAFVVGVGPGFTAGIDCHCVIETKRGHYLGNTIYSGGAIPNTGVPGEIGGYSTERIIRASAEGSFKPIKQIGDKVETGDIVAESGGVGIPALMPGIIRGMLQEGVHVTAGMKCGDIDARCELQHCYTISDKARAIAGGVLEAVSRYERRKNGVGVVLLAAGASRRYGSNKLLDTVNGKRMFEFGIDAAKETGCPAVVVTGYDDIAEYAERQGIKAVYNRNPELGISESLKLGLKEMNNRPAVMFAVSDQPGVTGETFGRLIHEYAVSDRELACMGQGGNLLGNPCIFGRKYYAELEELDGDVGGKRVIMKHREDLTVADATAEELEDIDFKRE